MKILVTGATGYIGHELAEFLAKKGEQVNVLVRDLKSDKIPKHENIMVFKGDICNPNSIKPAMQGCECVFHVAAFTDLRCSKINKFFKTNVDGTKNILETALELQVKKVIFTSTLSVYGPAMYKVPINEKQPRLSSVKNDYELTKIMAEELVLQFSKKGLHTCILNVTRVYGPGLKTFSNGLNKLISKFNKNRFLFVPNRLETEANYVFIQDVIQAHYYSITKGKSGERYIIGGENTDYLKLFKLIKSLAESNIKVIKINYKTLHFMVSVYYRLSVLLKVKIMITPKIIESLFTHRSASSQKALKVLGYNITPLKTGLENTVDIFRLTQ